MSQSQSNDIYQTPESFSPERVDENIVKSLVKRRTQLAVINELRLKGKDASEAQLLVTAALPEAKKRLAKRNIIYHILFFVGLFLGIGYPTYLYFFGTWTYISGLPLLLSLWAWNSRKEISF